jgi:hypothetical protein
MTSDSALFELSQAYFQDIVAVLAINGITVSPKLQLSAADSLLCYYGLKQQTIFLSLPDRDSIQGKLQLMLLRSLFACTSNMEVIEFLQLALHWLVSHEIAHHLRHQADLLSINIWHEEQIANHLAIALSKPRFSEIERQWLHAFLQRATNNLAQKLDDLDSAVNSYGSLLHSLQFAGLIDMPTLKQTQLLQIEAGFPSEFILRKTEMSNPNISTAILQRIRIIGQFNSLNKDNIFRHLYYYFGWMDIALMSSESYSVAKFANQYLNHASVEQNNLRRNGEIS